MSDLTLNAHYSSTPADTSVQIILQPTCPIYKQTPSRAVYSYYRKKALILRHGSAKRVGRMRTTIDVRVQCAGIRMVKRLSLQLTFKAFICLDHRYFSQPILSPIFTSGRPYRRRRVHFLKNIYSYYPQRNIPNAQIPY